MPSQKNIDSVKNITDKLKSAKSAGLFQYQGLNAAEVTRLRDNVRDQGGSIEVVKNSLLIRGIL